jgi:hypothetical protein
MTGDPALLLPISGSTRQPHDSSEDEAPAIRSEPWWERAFIGHVVIVRKCLRPLLLRSSGGTGDAAFAAWRNAVIGSCHLSRQSMSYVVLRGTGELNSTLKQISLENSNSCELTIQRSGAAASKE